MDKSSDKLISNLMKDLRWLNYKDVEGKNAVFFLIEAVNRTEYKSEDFRKLVELIIEKDKTITPQTLSLVTTNNIEGIFNKALNQFYTSRDNLTHFVVAC